MKTITQGTILLILAGMSTPLPVLAEQEHGHATANDPTTQTQMVATPTPESGAVAEVQKTGNAVQAAGHKSVASGADFKPNPMHPPFNLLDHQGRPLIKGQADFSVDKTCGTCHDVEFINKHNTHKNEAIDCVTCHVRGKAISSASMDEFGLVRPQIEPPTPATCGSCHGGVNLASDPLEIRHEFLEGDEHGPFGATLRTGQFYSSHQVKLSLLNIEDKCEMDQPWDVHAARGLTCSNCHFPPNSPKMNHLTKNGLRHLDIDPRTPGIADYLKRPNHDFLTAQCTDCHDPKKTHESLPFAQRHMETLACQSCHSPSMLTPVLQSSDHTVVTAVGGPRMTFRGVIQKEYEAPNTWFVKPTRPFLLKETRDGVTKFAPYNVVAKWQWVAGDGKPVARDVVKKAFLDQQGKFHGDILTALDKNKDGTLDDSELVLDPAGKDLIARKLVALGVKKPVISGSIESHPVRHQVVRGDWTASECESCHMVGGRMDAVIDLGNADFPGGVAPKVEPKTGILTAEMTAGTVDGKLIMTNMNDMSTSYVLGHGRSFFSDTIGFLLFVASAFGLFIHGLLRYFGSRRYGKAHHEGPTKRVYMYGIYERIWHWLMALSIILLLLTGFQIHYPNALSFMGFEAAVAIHNVMASILILNAALSLFFHIATGEIRQFLPQPKGLVGRLLLQTMYYARGIFTGAAHPIAKVPERKLNPLQQLTYLGLLNVLFPLQVITGVLLWIGGVNPEILRPIGGMSLLGPLHNLGSWLFLTFLIVHVYLTTTGHTLTSNISAMIGGWEDIEAGDLGETHRHQEEPK